MKTTCIVAFLGLGLSTLAVVDTADAGRGRSFNRGGVANQGSVRPVTRPAQPAPAEPVRPVEPERPVERPKPEHPIERPDRPIEKPDRPVEKPDREDIRERRQDRYTSAEFYAIGCDIKRVFVEDTYYFECNGIWYKRAYSVGEVHYVRCDPPPGH